MPDHFDPYYKWLGIPPAQQPPHHYRLLGIELFESDVEVIDMAANQRMSYLQEMAGGAHGKESQRLLNEVSAARRCLLDKSAKSAYDDQLRTKLPKPAAVVVENARPDDEEDTVNVSPTVSLPAGKLAPKPAKAPPAKAAPASQSSSSASNTTSDTAFDFKINETKGGKHKSPVTKTPASKTSASKSSTSKPAKSKSSPPPLPTADGGRHAELDSARHRKKKSRLVPVALAIVLLAAAAGGGFEFYRRSQTPVAQPPVAAAPSTAPSTTAASTSPAPSGSSAPTAKSTAAPAAPTPTASPSSSAAEALAMFTSALKSQSVTDAESTAKVPAGGRAATKATPSPTAAKSPILAAAEAGPPPELMFLAGAPSANAAAPGIHLQPKRNLLGKPVGFFKSGAQYHLFYESVVIAKRAASEPWGHAVSSDLLTWREAPLTVTIDPKRPVGVGSVFIDAENASGLGEAGKPVWLAACTLPGADDKKIDIGYASSRDQGATWTFAKDPVLKDLPAETRRPRIVRDAERKQWLLVVTIKESPKPTPSVTYALYTSPDLKTWTKKQDVPLSGGVGAPEVFEIAEAAPGKVRRWIFAAADGRYMLGEFDGERFTTANRGGRLAGAGYTWFRTLDDSPGEARRLALAVLPAPAAAKQPPYGLAVTLPQVFTLAGGEAAPALSVSECDELQPLLGTSIDRPAGDLAAAAALTINDCGPTFRFTVNVERGNAEAIELSLFGEKIRVDFKTKQQTVGGANSPYEATTVQWQGIVDREIAELRTPTGRVAFTTKSGPGVIPFKLDAIGGTAKLLAVRVSPLVRPAGKP